jgi:hypothetical protein
MSNEDWFDDKNFDETSEMSSLTIDFGEPGDFILGTFIKARHGIETQFGTNSIYEITAERGQFHKLTGKGRKAVAAAEPTVISKGETWSIWGRGDIMCGQMNSLRPGQIVKVLYAEEKEGKNGTWKLVKVYAPRTNEGKPMFNQEWLDAQGVSAGDM